MERTIGCHVGARHDRMCGRLPASGPRGAWWSRALRVK